MTPLFGQEDRVILQASTLAPISFAPLPDLSVFYNVDAPVDVMAALADELIAIDEVSAAYVKPAGEPPVLNDMTPAAEDAPPATPDFISRQIYLDPAPAGIDARYAWTWPGGGGTGVTIIDCEWGWRFDHEDLVHTQGGVVVGAGGTDTNHGTAVIGEISGDRNTFGITGICPDAMMSAAAFSLPSASVITAAANRLNAGDLLLLEIHRAGPRHNFQGRQDQLGYIAIEWWPDDFAAIAFATGRGVIVVEAAGNGAENLDDPIYSTRPPGFPATWTNPFNRANRDCGAIVVGAGAPPPNTHGRNHGADRSRLGFSNFGALVDAQGWGREVTSAGYGDLQGGGDARLWYTDTFSGTSSASPIVTGAVGCLQGALRAAGKPAMTPASARSWLRASGSPQQDEPGRPATQRIGNRPDLRQLINSHVKAYVLLDKGHKEAKLEKLERKELKDSQKELKVEKERGKDKLEIKEGRKDKVEKEQIKDFKEIREGKRFLDERFKPREVFEREDLLGRGVVGGGPSIAANTEDRISQLEQAVDALSHFITEELRPDLSVGALNREPDLWDDAAASKYEKDLKDKEHLAENG